MKRLNLNGMRFGRLVVVGDCIVKNEKTLFSCLCDCGNKKVVGGSNLKSGTTTSCGCYQKDMASAANRTHGVSNKAPEYMAWTNMKTRCYREAGVDYADYGGRGIGVCERWINSFQNFLEDMGKRPSELHSIERLDVDGDYSPENCYWATDEAQSRNKRNNRWIEFNGVRMILSDWAQYFGVNQSNLSNSIKSKGIGNVYAFYLEKHGSLPVESFLNTKASKFYTQL